MAEVRRPYPDPMESKTKTIAYADVLVGDRIWISNRQAPEGGAWLPVLGVEVEGEPPARYVGLRLPTHTRWGRFMTSIAVQRGLDPIAWALQDVRTCPRCGNGRLETQEDVALHDCAGARDDDDELWPPGTEEPEEM